jgi:hypothetical protein
MLLLLKNLPLFSSFSYCTAPFYFKLQVFLLHRFLSFLPELFRISILLGWTSLTSTQPMGTTSVGFVSPAVIRSAFFHQWEAAKVPDSLVAADESLLISDLCVYCILFDINVDPFCDCCVYMFLRSGIY